jgi:hypothetical protein
MAQALCLLLTQVVEIHSEYVLLFRNNSGYTRATEFYVYACCGYIVYNLCNTFTKMLERRGETETRHSCFSAATNTTSLLQGMRPTAQPDLWSLV